MTAHPPDADIGPTGFCRLGSPGRESAALGTRLRVTAALWSGPVARAARAGDGRFAALCFDATAASAHRVRGFLCSTLRGWRLDQLVEDATAVAAELVANAVTHALRPSPARRSPAAGTAWLALAREDHAVLCAVADPSPALPALREPEPFAESGRGLHIVAELSETWGHAPSQGPGGRGKTVWARLAGGR